MTSTPTTPGGLTTPPVPKTADRSAKPSTPLFRHRRPAQPTSTYPPAPIHHGRVSEPTPTRDQRWCDMARSLDVLIKTRSGTARPVIGVHDRVIGPAWRN